MEAAARRPSLLCLAIIVQALFAALAGGLGCSKKTSEPPVPPGELLASAEVGPSGGSLEVPLARGTVHVVVPPGALADPIRLTARTLLHPPAGAAGPVIELGPHGTNFREPVAVRFTPAPEDLVRGIPASVLQVATLVDGRWSFLPTSYPAPNTIEGKTTHFSPFALVAPCQAAGVGVDFPLTGCPTFNPRIQTSAPTAVNAAAANVTLRLRIGPSASAQQVDVTLSGFDPGATYYLLRDDDTSLLSLTADPAGRLYFQQETTREHLALLMANHGSIRLTAATCPDIGTWNGATNTCTMNADFPDPPVYIEQDGLTLDCKDIAGTTHLIGGPARQSVGIYLYNKSGVKVRNCNIANVDLGLIAVGPGFVAEGVSASVPLNLD
ncbi:MAG: hypothetical protein ACYC8T_30490, partial [Myxococcaceae bacterium]